MSPKKIRRSGKHMGSRRPAPPERTERAGAHRPRVTALIRLDTKRIRQRLTRDCLKARARCEASEAAWRRFKEEEEPAFRRWVAGRFGTSLSEARQLESALGDKEVLLEELEHYHRMYGGSRHSCWIGLAMLREISEKEEKARMEAKAAGKGDGDDFDGDNEADWDEFGDDDDDFDDFGKPPHDSDGFRKWLDSLMQGLKAPGSHAAHGAARIKDLYRRLCRKLHPDVAGAAFDERKLRLWHEVQAAYGARDVDRLESLLAQTEMADGGFDVSTSATRIIAMTHDFKQARLATERLLRKAKSEPCWDFLAWTPVRMEKVAFAMKREIDANLDFLRRQAIQWEKELDLWRNPPIPKKKKARFDAADPMQSTFDF